MKLLLICLFTISSLFSTAQSQEPIKFFINNSTANIGDTVNLNISVQNFKDFKSGIIYFSYQDEIFSYAGFSNSAFKNVDIRPFNGEVLISLLDSTNFLHNLPDNATFITLKMRIKEAPQDGTNSALVYLRIISDNLSDLTNKKTVIGYSGCININAKPISKLNFDSKIESQHCNGNYTIKAKNVNNIPNIVYNWSNAALKTETFYDTYQPFYTKSLYVTDANFNKLFIAYFIGSDLFNGEIPFTTKVEMGLENCVTPFVKIQAMGGKPPYKYQFEGFQPSSNNVFKEYALGGRYNVFAIDSFGCNAGDSYLLNLQGLFVEYDYKFDNCPANTGKLTVTTQGGIPPYKTYLDDVLKSNAANATLDNVSIGKHRIKVVDSTNCVKEIETNFEASNPIKIFATFYSGDCLKRNVKIDLFTRPLPSESYQYQLDNGPFQPLSYFENIPIGLHSATVKDINDCNTKITFTVTPISTATYFKEFVNIDCANHRVDLRINPSNTSGPFKIKYWVNNIELPTPADSIYRNIPEGEHKIQIEDGNGCILKTADTISLNYTNYYGIEWDYKTIPCQNKGKLSLKVPDYIQPFLLFKLDNSVFLFDRIFENVDTGKHLLFIKARNSCLEPLTLNLKKDTTKYDCVWPGDTDTTGIVNAQDLLNIGLAYGETGFKRDSMDIEWRAHFAKDWLKRTPTVDFKHIDTNGDGVINDNDTLAISKNWGLIHQLKNTNAVFTRGAVPPLYVKQETVVDGNNNLQIILGDNDLMAQNIYGLVFTIDFDETLIDENSVYASFKSTWLGESTILGMYKVQKGKIQVCLVRKNKIATNGAGAIARLYFKTKPNVVLKNIRFSIENPKVINDTGQEIVVITKTTVVNAFTPIKDIIENIDVKIFPNPTTDKITIESSTSQINEIKIMDALGKIIAIYKTSEKRIEIPLSNWVTGYYFVKIKTSNNLISNPEFYGKFIVSNGL
jgi:Secretion system C-terminal sorting domain